MYLVRCADESLYTGITKDVEARISAHNSGKGAAYTRSRRPVSLVYHRKGLTRSAALIEEARIKSLERPGKLALLKKTLRTVGRAAGALALLWCLAVPARAVPGFDKEDGIILSSAVPQAFTGEATYAPLRMYYLTAISSAAPHSSTATAILSATSVDGVAFTKETGVRVDTNTLPSVSASSITGAAVQPITGGFRMLYSIISTTGAFRIHTAASVDGLTWSNAVSPAIDGGTTYVGVPRVVILNSGDWRVYYTRDFNGGDDLADRRIFTALSTDQGLTWGASTIALSTTAYESGVAKLTDGRVRLFYSQPPPSGSSATVILSAISNDALGTSFADEPGVRVSTPAAVGALAFPVPVRSTDSFRWRLYYSFFEAFSSTGDIRSALTGSPAPVSVTPAVIYRSAAPATLTVAGEVFSLAPTVSITQGAVTVVGTAPNRTDDQHVSATFATTGLGLGRWDVTVTNADIGGAAGTAANALLVDFAPGNVTLTGNLLRPRLGGSTTIDVEIFNSGHVTIRVHDLEGRPLRTLFDGEQAAGSFGVQWDGKNASGTTVPSGLYFVAVTGPRVSVKSKIVVIR